MSLYKSGIDRYQSVLFNDSYDDLVSLDSDVRVIDAFVDYLDLNKLGFKYSNPSSIGNKPYNPADLLKLYLFGYRFGIRSSRKLMYQAKNNIEVIWLINGIKPDFRTISDFRKDNIKALKSVLFEFNLVCKNFNLISNIHSQDGTKIKAVNSKDKNFTLSKIDDRKKRIYDHIQDYLTDLDSSDELDSSDKLTKINELKDKLDFYNSIEKELNDNNLSQKSFTDPDSKLMKDNGKFTVAYNNQVLVDCNSHIITNFDISSNPADLGSMNDICSEAKDVYDLDSLTNVTDKGYFDRNDMMNCLNNGIIPEVTPNKDTNEFVLETDFVDNDITDDIIKSNNPNDIKTCLSAGVIPDIYKDKISNIEVKDDYIYEDSSKDSDNNLTDDQARDLAIKDYCFVRNNNSNKVFCPMGEILRKKSSSNGYTKYCNKLACKNCKHPCTLALFKEVSFSTNQSISYPKSSKRKAKKNRRNKIKVKKVFITLKPNYDLLKIRMGTSEHPHAQMKFWDNSKYLLLKGKEKVTGEVALYYCAYNLRRLCNLIDNKEIIKKLRELKKEKETNISQNIHFFFKKFFFHWKLYF